jgi:hypothetical protein
MDDASWMAIRRRAGAGLAVGWIACAASAGCTALLGDFSNSSTEPDGGATLDGQSEPPDVETPDGKAGADATMSSDAPSEAGSGGDVGDGGDGRPDAAPPPLTCKKWLYAQPVTLEVLTAGNRNFGDPIFVFPLPSGRIRVVAGKSAGFPFSVYSIDTSQATAQVTQLDAPAAPNAVLAAGHRSGSSIQPYTSLAFFTKPAGTPLGSYYAYVLPDSMLAMGPLPADFQLYQETAAVPTVDLLHILPFSATDLFAAIVYPTQTAPTNYLIGIGRATTTAPATLTTAVTSPNADDERSPILFHANSNVYLYDENDNSSPGLSVWAVPDTAVVTTPPAKRAISGGAPAFLHDIVDNTMSASADVAYQSGIVNAQGGAITYRAGTVAFGNLDTWVSTDLPVVATYSDATLAPVFPAGVGVDSRWTDDSMMLLGPGSRAVDAGGGPGLNLLWFDATGTLRSEESGSSALLTDRSDFTSTAATPISVTATSARWAVAWVETKSDDAGSYDTLFFNELDCQ